MSDRFHALLAWSIFAAALLILGLGWIIPSQKAAFFVLFSSIATPFAVVGALVASRRPGNPIGWLFVVFAVAAAFTAFGDRYAYYALVERPGALPGGDWVAWLSSGLWHPAFGFFVFAFLLFPNGRLPSRRWRPVAYTAGALYLMGAVLGLLWGPLFGEFFPYTDLPFQTPGKDLAFVAFDVFLLGNFALLLLSAISLVLRLRRAVGIERQQLKWFVYAVALLALIFPATVLAVGDGSFGVPLLSIVPASAGIAILRHRLFDIDIIVNRTLVYGALTVMLVFVYVASVFCLQYLLRAATGETSQLAVVASTLAIAALFNPLRRRIQGFIDRLFYRKKYDARRTLEGFSHRLREETDLETLGEDLASVTRDALQPEHVSMWLRDPASGQGRTRS